MAQQMVQLGRKADQAPETFTDPVCKMLVTPESAAATYEYNGEKYYFCAVGCKERFAADPDKYLSQNASTHQSNIENPRSEIEYTCPMHAEIVQSGPGSCLICGMAIEPKEVTLEDLPDAELIDMRRRF